ncbi:MAG: hypothetical protein JNK99_07755 [Candidatus Accumulibacter sp.]|uniref:hypothetical protein n=1 Tax=Accumulibacter sp. TaxID=2053492 RepID=UPI001A421FD0|nr:hypothetical protein [Accumulibacter sp.]MBL8394627.1 hypothetical protein [Accumulibacter sp.]
MQGRTRGFGWLIRHWFATYVLMTVSFVAFGGLSLDLVQYLAANASFLLEYGLLALMEGGLWQFVELWLKALLAIAAYLVFKLCEQALIQRLANQQDDRRDKGTIEKAE